MNSSLSKQDLLVILAAAAAMGSLAQHGMSPGLSESLSKSNPVESRLSKFEASAHIAATKDWQHFMNKFAY
jgi:hypothetical protein